MIHLQWLTGMRSQEVRIMRMCDIDMSGPIWLYTPKEHKTEHHGHERVISLGLQEESIMTAKREDECRMIAIRNEYKMKNKQ